jgi:phosphatidylethanolamine N-methyltransferase
MLVLIIFYAFVWMFFPRDISKEVILAVCFLHAVTWCLIHYIGLGLLLRAQGRSKFLVRHFMKNYHYPDSGKGAVVEAFANWKAIYNMSMCMTYGNMTFPTSRMTTMNLIFVYCQSPVSVLWGRRT